MLHGRRARCSTCTRLRDSPRATAIKSHRVPFQMPARSRAWIQSDCTLHSCVPLGVGRRSCLGLRLRRLRVRRCLLRWRLVRGLRRLLRWSRRPAAICLPSAGPRRRASRHDLRPSARKHETRQTYSRENEANSAKWDHSGITPLDSDFSRRAVECVAPRLLLVRASQSCTDHRSRCRCRRCRSVPVGAGTGTPVPVPVPVPVDR